MHQWGGPRHGEVDEVPADSVAYDMLVQDGPRWIGVYERLEPLQVRDMSRPAEVWVVRE